LIRQRVAVFEKDA